MASHWTFLAACALFGFVIIAALFRASMKSASRCNENANVDSPGRSKRPQIDAQMIPRFKVSESECSSDHGIRIDLLNDRLAALESTVWALTEPENKEGLSRVDPKYVARLAAYLRQQVGDYPCCREDEAVVK